jgi:hypothetical protein
LKGLSQDFSVLQARAKDVNANSAFFLCTLATICFHRLCDQMPLGSKLEKLRTGDYKVSKAAW